MLCSGNRWHWGPFRMSAARLPDLAGGGAPTMSMDLLQNARPRRLQRFLTLSDWRLCGGRWGAPPTRGLREKAAINPARRGANR